MQAYEKGITRDRGFTIVELLIVIVVIAILAAISIVAYNGIQNRTNDSTVQADLRNFAGKIMEYQAINGAYPNGGGTNGPTSITFRLAKSSYATNMHNFIYCVNQGAGSDKFIVTATSKSGNRYSYSNDKGLASYSYVWGGVVGVCTNEGYSSYNYSYGYRADGVWWDWTNGQISVNKNGFTIVELLIVIVVIAVLASISIVAYNGMQTRTRDAQRSQDVKNVIKALELYYADKGTYPNYYTYTPGSTVINDGWSTTADGSWNNLVQALKPYATNLPTTTGATSGTPAISGGTNYDYFGFSDGTYCSSSRGQGYLLVYRLESGSKNETIGTCGGTPVGYYGSGSSNYRVVKQPTKDSQVKLIERIQNKNRTYA